MMIFSWQNIDALGFQYVVSLFNGVVNRNLICAFTDLSFSVEHEAAAECVDFIIEGARGVRLSTLDALLRIVVNVFPLWFVVFDVIRFETSNSDLSNFFVCIVIETTKKISSMVDSGKWCTFSWSWLPIINWHFDDGYIETFSLLHSLDVSLETSSQFFNEFVSRDVIGRLSNEKFWAIIIFVRAWIDHLNIILNSAFVQLSIVQLMNGVSEIPFWIRARLELRNSALVVNIWNCSSGIHLLWRET